MLYKVVRLVVALLCKVLFRMSVRGVSNIPASGGFILASNHVSFLDPVVLGGAWPGPLNFMARESLFKNRIFGRLISALGTFPVKQGVADVGAFKEAIARVKGGTPLLIFPEGTRNLRGGFLPGKLGVGLVAVKSGAAIVPALVEGSEKALPPDKIFIRPRKVRVSFGRPIDISTVGTDLPERKRYELIAEKVMSGIAALQSSPSV